MLILDNRRAIISAVVGGKSNENAFNCSRKLIILRAISRCHGLHFRQIDNGHACGRPTGLDRCGYLRKIPSKALKPDAGSAR